MKIYVVTKGQYSDYQIVGVFTDKLKAQALCDLSGEVEKDSWYGMRIETYESDIIDVQGKKFFFVRMQPDGKVLEVGEESSLAGIEDENYVGRDGVLEDIDGNLFTSCLARDEKHAIKIMSERKLRYEMKKLSKLKDNK